MLIKRESRTNTMLIEILLALIIGIIIGSISGITPGIHINLISAMLLSFSAFLMTRFEIPPLAMVVFLVSIAMTHTFVDFVPSIFLGAPDEDSALSILPGHEFLLEGKAYQAVVYTLYGGLTAILIILLFSPIFFFFLPKIYPYAVRIMPYILILTSIFLIYTEKTSRIWAIIIFGLSGLLGIVTMSIPMKESLLALFTGLFGISSLITSIAKKQKIPEQKTSRLKTIKIGHKSLLKSICASTIASPLCSFLPGMGSGQAAIIGSEILGDLNRKEFLILLGSINTIVTGLSFVTLYAIGKARTGVAVAVEKLMELKFSDLWIITAAIVISSIAAFFISLYIAKGFSKFIYKINYKILSISIILFLLIINYIFSGFLGLLILVTATLIGLTCIYAGIRRTHLMGCLLIPTILIYLI